MDESELTRLVELFSKTVYRVALCYTNNHADAEDIMQDVFLKLYISDKAFNDDEHIKAWLIRVTSNACKNLLKSNRSRLTEPLENAEDIAVQGGGTQLLPLVMKLKPKNRVVLYMHYYEDYPVKEIAEILHLSQTVITSRLSRGRKQLKLLIEEDYSDA